MRILYLSQYFPPEAGATQNRAEAMVAGLVKEGHEVTVLTEIPNHPSGKVLPAYRRCLWRRRSFKGADVVHLWVYTSEKKNSVSRLAFYTSYLVAAVAAGLLLRRRFDLIYASSPPLFTGFAGSLLSMLRRTTFVLELRDLWPEAALQLGELKDGWVARLLSRMARCCYRRSSRIVAVTPGIQRAIIQQGVPAKHVALIPNGSDTERFRPRPQAADRFRLRLGLKEKFLVVYAGILGVAQGLETVIEAAALLHNKDDIVFLLAGAGPREVALRQRTSTLQLSNLQFLGEMPPEDIAALLSAADLALVPLRAAPVCRESIPSKMFDAWACACPTVISSAGEAQRLLEEAGAGRYVEPENPALLAEAISELEADQASLKAMGNAGLAYVRGRFDRGAQARELSALLEHLVSGKEKETAAAALSVPLKRGAL